MIKINIKNKADEIKWSAKFKTQAEADAWIAQEIQLKSWGKPDRWVLANDPLIQQEDISKSIESVVALVDGINVFNYHFAAEYSVNIIDLTAEYYMDLLRKKRDQLLADTDYLAANEYGLNAASLVAIKAYRKALRDLPENTPDPVNPVWPVMPQLMLNGGKIPKVKPK